MVYIFPRVEFFIYVPVLNTLKSARQKLIKVCSEMFAFFKAIFRFCTTSHKRLFADFSDLDKGGIYIIIN